MFLMIHRMVDRGEEDLDPPLAPLVECVRSFVQAVQEAEGDANNPAWEVGFGS